MKLLYRHRYTPLLSLELRLCRCIRRLLLLLLAAVFHHRLQRSLLLLRRYHAV